MATIPINVCIVAALLLVATTIGHSVSATKTNLLFKSEEQPHQMGHHYNNNGIKNQQYSYKSSTDERQKLLRARSSLLRAKNVKKFKAQLNAQCEALQREKLNVYLDEASATNATGCENVNGTAACCFLLNVQFKFIHIHKQICLNTTYLPESKSIRVVIGIDGRAVFNMTLSATNPPPLCIPFLVGEMCFQLYELKVENHQFSGCSQFELILLHQTVIHQKLGCFKLPFPAVDADNNSKSLEK